MHQGECRLVPESHEDPNLINLRIELPEVGSQLSVVVGDCLHNLRSPLDYLVWQLVILAGTHQPGKHTLFPISETTGGWARQVGKQRRLLGVATAARNLIEAFQPYQASDPSADPLWLLSELMNIDKHRTLTVARSATVDFQTHFELPIATLRFAQNPDARPYVNHQVVIRGIPRFWLANQTEAQGQGTLLVVFQDPPAGGA